MDLTDKVAVVTGAGRGIGRAVALSLAQAGARVVVNSTGQTAASVAAEIKAAGGQGVAVVADISSPLEATRLVEATLAEYDRLDILVNNAGINRDRLVMRMSDEEWGDVLRVNLTGVFLCTRAVLKAMMKQRWGRIINMTSVVGLTGNAGQANYAAAKAGIIGFTRSVAREVALRGITVNAIAPGFIETDMTRQIPEGPREELLKRIPLGSAGTPADVAAAAVFLASEGAKYITGQVLSVDGGMVMA
ncbi:MAG: 3-oxoacyl-[acyl-carrier-protein] reductase [Dehalococcoidales bacterium]